MLDELPVRYHWAWDFQVDPKAWPQLRKGEQQMDQKQREHDLKALRKIRDVIEEGRIGRALVLINREIQDKALPKQLYPDSDPLVPVEEVDHKYTKIAAAAKKVERLYPEVFAERDAADKEKEKENES